MKNGFTDEDRKKIGEGIRQRYAKAAQSPEGHFHYPTGKAGLEALGYEQSVLGILPDEILASYCGVGQPFLLGQIKLGESVLDIGCGAGVDTIIAATMVGPQGKTVGIDFVPEMVQRAKQNLQITQLKNVSFELGSGEDLPFASESFDCVISNGAYNLIPDKTKALQEAFRVLKRAGRFMIADQVLSVGSPSGPMAMVETWAK